MSTWIVAGQATDLTSDVEDLVLALLNSVTNWVETDPAFAAVVFGTDWWDDYGDYQVHCKHNSTRSSVAANGWRRFSYHSFVDIHIFCRRTTEDKPTQLGKMQRQIEKIIGQNVGNVGQGIQGLKLNDWTPAHDPDNLATTWHVVGTVELIYHKVNTA